MNKTLFALTGAALSIVAFAAAAETGCNSSPKLVGECFDIRGKLYAANGYPEFRIMRVGTKRILGVFPPGDEYKVESLLPQTVRVHLSAETGFFEKDLLGDYRVCPLSVEQTGRMQRVCIEEAENLTVIKRK